MILSFVVVVKEEKVGGCTVCLDTEVLEFAISSLLAVYHDWFLTAKGLVDMAAKSLNVLLPAMGLDDRRRRPGGDGIPPTANAAAAASSRALASMSPSIPPKNDDPWPGKNEPIPSPSIPSLGENIFTKFPFIGDE